jgi:hypothetical protein
LEKKGKPTVTLCSDAFNNLAITIATARGMPSLRMVVVPHPIAGIPAEQVRAKADKAFEEIVRCLMGA